MRHDGPKIREHAEHPSDAKESLLGPNTRRRILPRRAAHGTQESRVSLLTQLDRFFRQRTSGCIDRRATDQPDTKRQVELEPRGDCFEDESRRGNDLWSDTIAGQKRDRCSALG
jgi:hypothetical protein